MLLLGFTQLPQPRVECHPDDVAGTFIASVSRDVLTAISRIHILTR
jgi:hypothetical protein